MQILTTVLKLSLLLVLAVISFGFGACGTLGMGLAFQTPRTDWNIVGLAVGGFVLMALFGWFTWWGYRAFFLKSPEDEQDGTGASQ